MKRAVFVHFREQKAQKRSAEAGTDLSYEEMDAYIGKTESLENISLLEYEEIKRQIMENLTDEQKSILSQYEDASAPQVKARSSTDSAGGFTFGDHKKKGFRKR